nr:hypothetical protein [Pseudonocardia ammonioxydans]
MQQRVAQARAAPVGGDDQPVEFDARFRAARCGQREVPGEARAVVEHQVRPRRVGDGRGMVLRPRLPEHLPFPGVEPRERRRVAGVARPQQDAAPARGGNPPGAQDVRNLSISAANGSGSSSMSR